MGQIDEYTPGAGAEPPGVRAVADRMRDFRSLWPAGDGVRVFNDVYLRVTQEIGRLAGAGAFRDHDGAATLAVRFAERYVAAVDAAAAGGRPPACWRPLFAYRRHPGVRPLQFALAGVNAHIGHDLALAVVDTCRDLDCEPARLEADFERVGEVLVLLEERVREELMPGPDLLEVADPMTHLLGCWSLERARDGAWLAARSLWQLRRVPGPWGVELAEGFAERLDRSVGLVGRMLLTPLGSTGTRGIGFCGARSHGIGSHGAGPYGIAPHGIGKPRTEAPQAGTPGAGTPRVGPGAKTPGAGPRGVVARGPGPGDGAPPRPQSSGSSTGAISS